MIHYRFNKSLPLVPIQSQIDPLHIIPSYLSKIHFNIVHPPYVLVFPVVSFFLDFPSISYMHSSSPPFMLHALLCHHDMMRPQVADGGHTFQVWRVAAKILNKQSWTAEKG
jgi:hypothetical protein